MLSYIGEIEDRWHGSYDDEDHYHYRQLCNVVFSLSRSNTLESLYLTFNVTNRRKADALVAFLKGESSRVSIDGSEGFITIGKTADDRHFVFSVNYQGPYVKLEFVLDHEACRNAFSAILSDLEKYPPRE